MRRAANLCVNREELKVLLNGFMAVPQGTFPPDHPWWGNPDFHIRYAPDEARKLMAEAGYTPDKPLKVRVQTSASGSGQMQPIPMNEYVQENLKECGFDVTLDVVEWNTLFTNWRKGAKDESARGANATNVSFAAMDPFFAMVRFTSTKAFPPVSNNWATSATPSSTASSPTPAPPSKTARATRPWPSSTSASWRRPRSSGSRTTSAPRAIAAKVKGVVQPKSWFIDIATMSVE